ncbi:NAD-dependent deacylase [Geminicoccaceae bacterium 1502E]|nr:NAD-dependent deacylase [Geminicoccaceae bacterium 1502E]
MAVDRIVVLTGAGISAESGLATFRGPGGLWEGRRLEEVATPEAFRRDPALVHRFYNARRRRLLEPGVQPNPAHLALARLEAEWPGEVVLVTQNIDDLHARAGSRQLIPMHGELLRIRCEACGQGRACRGDVDCTDACLACGSAGTLRPDVVWFGEMPHGLQRIYAALSGCGLFLSIGTSGQVYPAAGFVEAARESGEARTVELNLEPSAMSHCFAERRTGPAARTVPALVDELLDSAARRG